MHGASNHLIRLLSAALMVAGCAVAQESRAASRLFVDTKAILAARASVTRAEQEGGADSTELVSALGSLALTLKNAGRAADGIAPARRGVAILEAVVPLDVQ